MRILGFASFFLPFFWGRVNFIFVFGKESKYSAQRSQQSNPSQHIFHISQMIPKWFLDDCRKIKLSKQNQGPASRTPGGNSWRGLELQQYYENHLRFQYFLVPYYYFKMFSVLSKTCCFRFYFNITI